MVNNRFPIELLAAILLFAFIPTVPVDANEEAAPVDVSEWGVLISDGMDWIGQNTDLDIAGAVDLVSSPENWQPLLREIEYALDADSFDLLASFEPEARETLTYLDGIEGAEPYADWLRQRLDYLEAACDLAPSVPARPAPPRAAPARRPGAHPPVARAPSAKPPAVRAPPPAPPESVDVWKGRLKGRSTPARAAALVPQLKEIFAAEGIPEELVWVAEVESSFNPEARSPAGAAGLFQLMPATAESLGVSTKPTDDRLDALQNARAAARYLRTLHGRFGRWDLALAAYNAGQGRVGRTLDRHGGRTFEDIAAHLPAETRMYVPKVLATVALRENVDLLARGS